MNFVAATRGIGAKIRYYQLILAADYMTKNEPENARESLNNIYHAHYLAKPKNDLFQSFLAFQKK